MVALYFESPSLLHIFHERFLRVTDKVSTRYRARNEFETKATENSKWRDAAAVINCALENGRPNNSGYSATAEKKIHVSRLIVVTVEWETRENV